ncbi:hypothetical protein DV515_00011589 [Chloebia gouldiae]|uniref:Uncharacterized protein n=1 Tax=Chloebia gouldiae TaxID=44316 RepID=A0A3L8S7B7_CHLGU|nr:hypothetical protein DV515_00011589 [Chloebia gouldiae]
MLGWHHGAVMPPQTLRPQQQQLSTTACSLPVEDLLMLYSLELEEYVTYGSDMLALEDSVSTEHCTMNGRFRS